MRYCVAGETINEGLQHVEALKVRFQRVFLKTALKAEAETSRAIFSNLQLLTKCL